MTTQNGTAKSRTYRLKFREPLAAFSNTPSSMFHLQLFKDMYKGIVEPNFNYCCSVWGFFLQPATRALTSNS